MRTEHQDIRTFLTAVAEHTCPQRAITPRDEQGKKLDDTFLGFGCACGASFVINIVFVKSIQRPLRPYLITRAERETTARRFTTEPALLLEELRKSGGWAQPDPGVTMMTAMAAAMGPPGNPMERRLNDMMKGDGEPE